MSQHLDFVIRFGLGCVIGLLLALSGRLFKTIVPLASVNNYSELSSLPHKSARTVMLRAYSRCPWGLVLPKILLFCSMSFGAAVMVEFYSASTFVNLAYFLGCCLPGAAFAKRLEINHFHKFVASESVAQVPG